MLFDTNTTLTAQASLDALWMQTQVISNNMANVDTPGFKASTVSFEAALSQASRQQNVEGQEVGVNGAAASSGGAGVHQARVSTDPSTSVRIDGNNVVLEEQQSELWKTYAQYSYLLDRISGHYNTIGTAINNMKTT